MARPLIQNTRLSISTLVAFLPFTSTVLLIYLHLTWAMQLFYLASTLAASKAISAAPLTARAAPVDHLVGFGASATGGGPGEGVTVTSCAQLTTALKTGGVIKINGQLAGCGVLRVPSDTTILGVGKGSGLTEGGFRLKDVNNVIIRNLELSPPKKSDAIDLETATNVWVDHCDLHSVGLTGGKDDYDGLFDAKRGSDKITVSWTKFHDHVGCFHISMW